MNSLWPSSFPAPIPARTGVLPGSINLVTRNVSSSYTASCSNLTALFLLGNERRIQDDPSTEHILTYGAETSLDASLPITECLFVHDSKQSAIFKQWGLSLTHSRMLTENLCILALTLCIANATQYPISTKQAQVFRHAGSRPRHTCSLYNVNPRYTCESWRINFRRLGIIVYASVPFRFDKKRSLRNIGLP
ncbi:hypothetical protein BU23DRAFT_558142 [Bimuria novae-zelandiae CBS 107.79]|uniref:Uncharacterized protein n=1 Tax=Bimuria novae-zelandiae CBS 107.79 TaxID=1447943 RepID=A0A6A5V1H5_9PLEO|nr:hypothetical protein BU23DRAFT_558142 [Bimuria novae-zelandiae CBS 107.79]